MLISYQFLVQLQTLAIDMNLLNLEYASYFCSEM